MSANLSDVAPAEETHSGLLSRLLCLARAAVCPLDRVLPGMVAAGLCLEALCKFLCLTKERLEGHIVRLGLRTPNDKPFRERAKGWSIADTQRLIAWRSLGVHPDIIAERVDRKTSASAVRAKCRRLGLKPPPRRELFRPAPTDLIDPVTGLPCAKPSKSSPSDTCGRAAGPIQAHPGEDVHPAAPVKKARSARDFSYLAGQRELPLLGLVRGSDMRPSPAAKAENAEPKIAPTPLSCETVDFSDLTWIGRLKRPLTYEPAVWAVGMLMMSGVHYKTAAAMTGKTEASFRTMRTRMRVPVDGERSKFVHVFDREVADATKAEANLIIRKAMNGERQGGQQFIWVDKNDRKTRYAPGVVKRDRQIEGRSPTMRIVTRAELDRLARQKVLLEPQRLIAVAA